jgi:hypothetical protein
MTDLKRFPIIEEGKAVESFSDDYIGDLPTGGRDRCFSLSQQSLNDFSQSEGGTQDIITCKPIIICQ